MDFSGHNSEHNNDRRKHPRLTKNLPLKLSLDGFDLVTETKNLSCSGAYCEINKYLEPLTKLQIILLLPFKKKDKIITKKFSCQGVVVRADSVPLKNSHYNIAIFFNDIQKKEMNKISDYLGSLTAKENLRVLKTIL